jgi:DNA-binding CsgD family transcriptional regulator
MEGALLALLGVDAATENIYRFLLSGGGSDVAGVQAAFELDDATVRTALERLRDLGMLNRGENSSEYFPVDPRHSLRSLVAAQEQQLHAVRDAIAPLAAVFDSAARTHQAGTQTHVVVGTDAVGDWFYRLKHQAVHEFLAFDRPPYLLATNEPMEQAILQRGVRSRGLYAAASFDEEGYWASLRTVIGYGEQARVVPQLPIKLAIADNAAAMMSLRLSAVDVEYLYTESAPLVATLGEVFEAYWATGVPLTQDDAQPNVAAPGVGRNPLPGRGPTDEERQLLALFGGGVKDESIAQQLGISSRTLRRRLQQLYGELGATNRFGAGIAATRRGWI